MPSENSKGEVELGLQFPQTVLRSMSGWFQKDWEGMRLELISMGVFQGHLSSRQA